MNTTVSTPIAISAGSPPTATILAPADGALFRAGDVISFSGDASDPDDGTLPASAYTWTIDFLHDGHVHPGASQSGIKSGTFTIPTSGHDFSGNTRYRITLKVTDSNGLTNTRSVQIFPRKVNLSFSTAPAGLTVYLDGIAKTTPFVYDTLVGFSHTVEARNQAAGGTSYTFGSWSDGGAQTHTIVVPAADQSYAATFQASAAPPAIAAWAFNEGSGTSAADASGGGLTGTLTNGATWGAGRNCRWAVAGRRERLRRAGQSGAAAAHEQHDRERVGQLGCVPQRRRGDRLEAHELQDWLPARHDRRSRAAHDRLQADQQLERQHVPLRSDHAAGQHLVPHRRRLQRCDGHAARVPERPIGRRCAGRHRHRGPAATRRPTSTSAVGRAAPAASISTAGSTTFASTAGR